MLAKKNRLTGNANFARVRSEGKMYQSFSFGMAVFDREDKSPTRVAFIVSSKVSTLATLRNRIKRALREQVRITMTEIIPGRDIVFLAKKASLRRSTSDIMLEVMKSLKGAKLLG